MRREDFILACALLGLALVIGLWAGGGAGGNLGDAAEWAGAIGTVGAIAAAISVGRQSIMAEERRTAARGRVVAFRLAPHMVNMLGDVRRGKANVKFIQERSFDQKIFIDLADARAFDIKTPMPSDIFSESWTLPPEIALSAAQLDMVLITHHRFSSGLSSTARVGDLAARIDFARRLVLSFDAVERLASEIRDHGARMSDEIIQKSRGAMPYS